MAKLSVTRGQTPAERARFALAESAPAWRINCWANWPAPKHRRPPAYPAGVLAQGACNGKVLSAADFNAAVDVCRSAGVCWKRWTPSAG